MGIEGPDEFRTLLPPLAPKDHFCADCDFDYSSIEIGDARALLRAIPGMARAELGSAPAASLRLRPDATRWSVLEYLCHVRDVYATFTIRLFRTQHEDRPALEPMLNDLRARRFRYNESNENAVLDELERNVAGFVDEMFRVRDWDRTATRLPEEVRTSRWLVRQALHEGLHHLADMASVRAQVHVVTKG